MRKRKESECNADDIYVEMFSDASLIDHYYRVLNTIHTGCFNTKGLVPNEFKLKKHYWLVPAEIIAYFTLIEEISFRAKIKKSREEFQC